MSVLYWSVWNTVLYLYKKQYKKFYFSETVDYLNGSTYPIRSGTPNLEYYCKEFGELDLSILSPLEAFHGL